MELTQDLTTPTEHDTAAHVVSVVDLLLTIGYIDGTLHDDEKAFIRGYLERLIEHVAHPLDSKAAWRAQIDSVRHPDDCAAAERRAPTLSWSDCSSLGLARTASARSPMVALQIHEPTASVRIWVSESLLQGGPS